MKKSFLTLLAALFVFVSYSQNTEKDCESAKNKYLQQNPDVANARIDAWTHYVEFGRKEGRKWPDCDELYQKNDNLKFEDFHNKFITTNSANSVYKGTRYPYPSNPPESFYKKDYYNGKLIYDGYVKQVVTSTSGNSVYKTETKHGLGKEYFTNSNGYLEGFFSDDKLSGYGVQVSDGYSYKGIFINGIKSKEGIIVSDGLNGTTKYIYEGKFFREKYHGTGTLIYDFMAFVGEFEEGRMSEGIAYYPNEVKYIGKFANEKYHGYGKYYWNNGNVYQGDFKDGKFHGSGELKYSNGAIQKGIFENGNYIGEEKQITQNNSNLISDNNQQSNANKFPNSKFEDLTIDGRTIKSKLEKSFLDLYSKAYAMHAKNSLLNKSTTDSGVYLENGILELKETVDGWLGGPMTDMQIAEFLEINKTTMNEVTSTLGLVSSLMKNSGSSSSSSSYSSNSSSSSSNSSNNSICSMCNPSNSKGHYIQDYDSNNKRYLNGRYLLRPGYKPCSTCRGTGNCKAYSMCSSSQERDGNYTCQRCHGDRFELCSRCKGSGK